MRVVFLAFLIFFFFTMPGYAQTNYTGLWEGKLIAGVEIRLFFKISRDASDKLTATLDCPDQGLKDVKVDAVSFVNDSLRLAITQFKAVYTGKLINDSVMKGIFVQGMAFPLELKKITHIVLKVRSQTPQPPFSYKSEDITYTNKDRSIIYGATITIPSGKGPFPAALLITGSGQQNRDEEIAGHKPFAVIADHLTKNGFIVLRVDDRGVGQTTGSLDSATSRDFANDALASLDYLASRKEVDKKNIGLIGHSEGGMIAQLIGAERTDIKFIIMLAAPGIKVLDLMNEQNAAVLTSYGLSKEYISKYAPFYTTMLKTIIENDSATFGKALTKAVGEWADTTAANIVMVTTGIKDEQTKKDFVQRTGEMAANNWFRYFLSFDPGNYLKKIKANVLALNGDKDIQVLSKSNLQGIESGLKQSKSKSFEVKELKGLNHLFQECKTCTVSEYGNLDQTFSPAVLEIMTAWLKKNTKL
ncbi:MAG: alpha/beta fold hydrolase [Chitinophagaceae bacterium]